MKKLLSVTLAAVMVPTLAFSSVSALAAGQIEGGDIYRVKNVKGGDFTDPVSATCGDTVQFKVRIHNPGSHRRKCRCYSTCSCCNLTQLKGYC